MQMMAEILVATLRRDGMRFIMVSDKKSGVTCFFLTPIPVCAVLLMPDTSVPSLSSCQGTAPQFNALTVQGIADFPFVSFHPFRVTTVPA